MSAIVNRSVPHLELLRAAKTGATFEPETIALMADALESAIADLPHPLGSRHAQSLATSILNQAAQGERDKSRLCKVALEAITRGT